MTPHTQDNLKPESLAWALAHTRKFGDTDIFPVPFEYDSIAHDWNLIGPNLANTDFGQIKIKPDRRTLVLKPGGGFRAAVQLDPLDHLLYTACVYEASDLIEKARVPVLQRIACSYRVQLTPDGAFFPPGNGWKDFHTRSKELAASAHVSHVLSTDISDFYNQLSQHRIQNALEMAGVSLVRSRNVEKFLNQSAAKQSQGLPVGPIASIVLAEANLIDVDNFLLRQGVRHTRYVDDFHIFCRSRKHAIETRHALSEYLFGVHRLSLGSSKSQVRYVDAFIKDLSDPEEQEQQAHVDRLNELLSAWAEENGPYWDGDEVPDESTLMTQAEQEGFVSLFRECLDTPTLNLGLARYLLRKAKRGRTAILHDILLDRLESLGPVLRDVVGYLVATLPKARARQRGAQILTFCRSSDIAGLPFVRMWILELLIRRPDLCSYKQALAFAEAARTSLGLRPLALLATAYKQIDWVRSHKETWRNNESWDRRAVIWSARVLPIGERRPFLTMVAEQGDLLDTAVGLPPLSRYPHLKVWAFFWRPARRDWAPGDAG